MEFNLSLKTGNKLQKKAQNTSGVKFWLNNVISDFWGTSATTDTTNLGIIKTLETLPDVYMITEYVAQIIANIPVKIVTPNGKESKNKELISLVREPNYYQNWPELIKQFTAYYELLGNSYIYFVKPEGMATVSKLHVLPAGYVKVVLLLDKTLPDWFNEVLAYQMDIGGKTYNHLAESVLHKRNISFQYLEGSYIYGTSKYIPGNKITTELKAIYDAKTSIISSRGAMGVLSNESDIPDFEESKSIKEKLKAATGYGLGSEQDKIIVTTQKLSWQQMTLGIAELQIIENAKYSFAKLCQLNGFDPVIFSTDGSTFANKAEAEKAFMKKVIKPKVDDLYNDLNTFLRPYFGGDMIVPDWSQIEELQSDKAKLTDMLVKQIDYGMITPYQAAVEIYGEVDETNPPENEYFRKTSLQPMEAPEMEQETPENKTGEELTTCEYCGYQFDYNSVEEVAPGFVKCPECNRTINQEGNGN